MTEDEYIACQNLAKLRAAESLIRDTYYEDGTSGERVSRNELLAKLDWLIFEESKKFKLRDVE